MNALRRSTEEARLVRRRSGPFILFLAWSLLASRTARASHPAVALRYERAPGADSCAGPDELRRAVAARLGYDPFQVDEGLDTIIVRIRPVGSGLEGTFERQAPSQTATRTPSTITSKNSSCTELMSALAVGIAIAVDPLSIMREPPSVAPTPAPPPPPPPPHAPPPPAPPSPPAEVTLPVRDPVLVEVGLGPAVSIGAVPAPSFGARAFVGVFRGIFELDLEGRFDTATSLATHGGSVEASLVLGTIAPCLRTWLVIACGELSLGELRGVGVGFAETHDGDTFYAAAGVRAGMEFSLGQRFGVRVAVEGETPLQPTQLYANVVSVWSTPAFAFAATPMLVGHFP